MYFISMFVKITQSKVYTNVCFFFSTPAPGAVTPGVFTPPWEAGEETWSAQPRAPPRCLRTPGTPAPLTVGAPQVSQVSPFGTSQG